MKTVQVTLDIGKNDLERKMRQAQQFLQKKQQVRVALSLHGRQRNNIDRAVAFLDELAEQWLNEFGTTANRPTAQNLSMTFNPRNR